MKATCNTNSHWPVQCCPSLWRVYPRGQMQRWEPGRFTHRHSHISSKHSLMSAEPQQKPQFDMSLRFICNCCFFLTHTFPLQRLHSHVFRRRSSKFPVSRWTLRKTVVSVCSQNVTKCAGASVGPCWVVALMHTRSKPLVGNTLVCIWIRQDSAWEL